MVFSGFIKATAELLTGFLKQHDNCSRLFLSLLGSIHFFQDFPEALEKQIDTLPGL
jgi:hypothetical protein